MSEFYLGSYSYASQPGIYKYELDDRTGVLAQKAALKGADNPSYLCFHPSGEIMYAVEELSPQGRIAVYSADGNELEYLYSVSSQGADPCHLSLDDTGRFLFVSNYTSGGLGVFKLDEQGKPVQLTDYKQHKGRGKNPERQEGPHVHFSQMSDGVLYVCDLGLDCIICYWLLKKNGKLEECGRIWLPEGSGPRHLAFHKNYNDFFYCVGELTGEVFVYKKNASGFEMLQRISSLPEKFCGKNTAAAIKFSQTGRTLFVSNRGNDSITSFGVKEDGLLEKKEIISSGGSGPRDFAVLGKYLVSANQYSDNLAVFEYNEESGKMREILSSEKAARPVMICPAVMI